MNTWSITELWLPFNNGAALEKEWNRAMKTTLIKRQHQETLKNWAAHGTIHSTRW